MPGRITDELRRITREQGGQIETSPAPGSAPRGTSSGRYGTLVAVALLAALVVGGWWLVRTMQADSKLQDCVMSGRKNCVPAPTETAP